MDRDPVGAAFEEWTRGCDELTARINLFQRVRDLAYRYPASRDPVEVLKNGAGSCSGKHYLLGELFRRQGLKVRHMMCTHRFNESPLPFPEEMQALLIKNEIVDVHDYLQIAVGDTWVDVDATWEVGLHQFGFPVTDEWDGRSSMLLTVSPDEHSTVDGDPAKVKDEMLARLTPRQRMLRKQFLEAMSKWVGELSVELGRER